MTTTSLRFRTLGVALATSALTVAGLVSPPNADAQTFTGVAEPTNYAVEVGRQPSLPAQLAVTTAEGQQVQAPVAWDLAGMTFAKPYKSYTVYGQVDGLSSPVTATVETLAPDTIWYVDSGTAASGSAAHAGAKRLLGGELLNDASDQAKSAAVAWGYSGQDGLRTDAGDKDANGLYGFNGAGNTITYDLTLPAGDYTLALGIHEWWSATDREMRASISDSQGRATTVVTSTPGQITPTNRTSAMQGRFTVPTDGAGGVKLQVSNVTWQGASVAWFAVAQGAQTLDLSPDVSVAPTISPSPATTYGRPQTISITAAAGAVVYYTTDGSTPSRTHGTLYTETFVLDRSTTVKAVAVTNGVTSPVTTADYTIVVQDGPYTAVPVGQPWFDTAGNVIQAHGGGFLEHGGWYYWVGEDKSHNGASFNGVNLYRSKDLLNWDFVAQILKPEAAGLDCNVRGSATCKVERPKLLFNEASNTFVLWGHWETSTSYAASEVVVATSSTIDGDYAVSYHGRPGAGTVWDLDQERAIEALVTSGSQPDLEHAEAAYRAAGNVPSGHQSRDFTVYVDDRGRGWLISAEAHEQLRIYPLSADYTQPDVAGSYPLFHGESREAAAITQFDGVYYLFTSGQSGWYPNQLKYATTTDLADPSAWSANQNVGNNTTFKSQPTSIMQVQRTEGGSSLVYMGDRWVPSALGTSTYVWLPLQIDPATRAVTLDYTDRWSLDTSTGAIVNQADRLVSQGKPATASPAGSLSAGYTDGVADPGEVSGLTPARAANDGIAYTTNRYDNSHYYTPNGTVPFTWQVDLGVVTDLSRVDISWRSYNGSESYSGYVLEGSVDGTTWSTLIDRRANRTVGFTSDRVDGWYRHVRVRVTSVVNDHNGSSAAWAAGLVEVQVYGLPETDAADGATVAPGQGVLSTDEGWDTGLKDGTFTVTMNLWHGANGSIFRLYRDGVLVDRVPLTMHSPSAQAATVDVAGLVNGTYVFTGELANSAGVTATKPVTVVVTDATPGSPQLAAENKDGDGAYTVTATLWWGTNATAYRILEDGVEVARGDLTAASPGKQSVGVALTGRAKGTHTYVAEFSNAAGVTSSKALAVKVTT
ncbi:FN3 associated domain-containing protein [Aestuariimicrobium soli]|uniref:FN3 associated domain-containing protein n=1 Tax=Aestuariimicrobium soli TaxID=2035834 RepID=UPI003EBE6588